MSFSGSSYNVGNLVATFALDAAPAQASITSVITQTLTLKNSFATTYRINVDNRQAVQAVDQTTGPASATNCARTI